MNTNSYISYLYSGYLNIQRDFEWLDKCSSSCADNEYDVESLVFLFDEVFDKLFQETNFSNHLIPLSGGWDSRAILGAALDRVDRKEIQTISFGTKGQLDFDIGKHISMQLGIEHFALDLNTVKFDWDDLLLSVKRSPWTYVPDAYFNSIARKTFQNTSVWVGFLGDPLAGSHLFDNYRNFDATKTAFIQRQQKPQKNILLPPNYKVELGPLEQEKVKTTLHWDDFFDLTVRQANCIAPIVLPVKRWSSWEDHHIRQEFNDVIAPFATKAWVSYWINAPRKLRNNQQLYLAMLRYKFPLLFKMPSKYYYGASAAGSQKYHLNKFKHRFLSKIYRHFPQLGVKSNIMLNYLDFNEMFRKRKDYQEVLATASDFLEKNDICPWIDIKKMNVEHNRLKVDHGTNFLLLIGLAANLCADNIVES